MDISVDIYDLDLENEYVSSIDAELLQDFRLLSHLLNASEYVDETTDLEYFLEDLEEYPPEETLSNEIIDKLKSFSRDVLYNDLDKIPNYNKNDRNVLTKLFNTRKILGEQLEYITDKEKGCHIWMVTARINRHLYGSVFVFYNPMVSTDVLMQGIARNFIPSLFEILQPGTLQHLPRLNSLLLPAVETIAKSMGSRKIFVAPVGNQGKILETHYGFKEDKNIVFPCSMIKGSEHYKQYNASNYYKTYSTVVKYKTYDESDI